ncbi:SGNH/GDSL hydrolase family protein [Microbacterium sp. HD4P20]|nr:SGNH/GDSL hydrolase family protein [Microbacterium sp. HD4P20]
MAEGAAWGAQLPSDRFTVVGGWAVDGATTASMAEGVSHAAGADQLVIMAGTNDLAVGVPIEEIKRNVLEISNRVSARDVLLVAIPPLNFLPAEAMQFNQSLSTMAAEHDWGYVDPWVELRETDGTWSAPFLTDGVHTSDEGYAAAGRAIAGHLEAVRAAG